MTTSTNPFAHFGTATREKVPQMKAGFYFDSLKYRSASFVPLCGALEPIPTTSASQNGASASLPDSSCLACFSSPLALCSSVGPFCQTPSRWRDASRSVPLVAPSCTCVTQRYAIPEECTAQLLFCLSSCCLVPLCGTRATRCFLWESSSSASFPSFSHSSLCANDVSNSCGAAASVW